MLYESGTDEPTESFHELCSSAEIFSLFQLIVLIKWHIYQQRQAAIYSVHHLHATRQQKVRGL